MVRNPADFQLLDATGLNGHVRIMLTLQREYASRSLMMEVIVLDWVQSLTITMG